MACFDPKCPCSNAPKCKCQLDWDIRCVCQPSDVWNCPVRVNTAVWLIDNDEDLHILARKRDFEGVRGWFDIDDEVSFHRTVSLYCDQMMDELCEEYVNRMPVVESPKYYSDSRDFDAIIVHMDANENMEQRRELSLWKQKKIEAELRIIKLAHDEEEKEEETCYSCEETKTDNWYYNLTPKKNAPVCTACRDREETCRCCEIKYPYYQIKHDSGGKYLCITCDNECPCADSKCGTVCPAVSKIVDALATKA